MNKFWLKKYEKSVSNARKGKTMERRFPSKVFQHFNNDKECFALFQSGFCICFFDCQGCKCSQLSHNYIKCDLSDPDL